MALRLRRRAIVNRACCLDRKASIPNAYTLYFLNFKMKKLIYFITAILTLSACVNNASTHQESAVSSNSESNFILSNIVDSVISANPDFLNNEIKQKKVSNEVQLAVLSAIQRSHNILTEIPLTFEMMMQNEDKYIIKFELSTMGEQATRISDKYNIYFNVFTEMSEEEASELIENHKYHLTFDSISDVNNNLVLPSGKTFTDNPNIYKTSFDECVNVCPGAFLLKGVKFSE